MAAGPEPNTPRVAAALPDGRWGPLEIAFWLIPLAAFFLLPDYRVLGSQILIVGLFAVSLDLILGYAGIVSLGHAAFFGIGAYTAGLLAVHGWGEPLTGLLAAAITAAAAGFVVSLLVVRGSDLTRLMVTLGIGLMLYEVANKAAWITGGVDGLSGVTMWKIFGVWSFDIGGRTAYLYSLGVLFVLFLFIRRLVNSPLGLSLRGIREGGKRMPAIGAPVARRLRTIFTVSAAVAGVAGALLAQTTQFVGIDTLGFPRSAELLVMLVLGGVGRLYGGLVGAAIFMLAQDYLAGLSPVYWQLGIGILLIVVVLFARGGVLGGLAPLREYFARGKR
jgi:branched-chain amino acid transport system permease protein